MDEKIDTLFGALNVVFEAWNNNIVEEGEVDPKELASWLNDLGEAIQIAYAMAASIQDETNEEVH